MKISREKLLTRVNNALDTLRASEDKRGRAEETRIREARDEYGKATHLAWTTFVGNVQNALECGDVVTYDMVPRELREGGWGGGIRFFSESGLRDRRRRPVTETDDFINLDSLRKMLEDTTSEEISTYAIERMGFKIGNLLRGVAR